MKPSEIIKEIIKREIDKEESREGGRIGLMTRKQLLTGTLMERAILEFLDSIPMLEREKHV